jgi:hypothetical protein
MVEKELRNFLDALVNAGWQLKLRNNAAPQLREPFRSRYPRIPEEYLAFMKKVASCVNPANTVWFLCEADYNGESDSAFRWNEFELQSLEAADGDEELADEIKSFWSHHLPIVTSVKSAYAYLAINVSEKAFGQVVAGLEPEYEEVVKICNSFGELIKLFGDALKEERRTSLLDDFI